MFAETLSNALRAIAGALRVPVMGALLLLMAVTLFMLGALLVELCTERARLRARLPALADRIRAGGDLAETIRASGLLRRQRNTLLEIINHPDLSPLGREALAARLLTREGAHYENVLWVTDLVARLGPMLGLMGTLIPLGPGIIALGQGDTLALSQAMLMAFDTTIAGLVSAAAAFVISGIRRKWYAGYMASLEMAAECVLEAANEKRISNEEQIQPETA
jgi:biopolymer transport protein ExbB/TolQ